MQDGEVELQAKPVVKIITGEELRDGTVEVLSHVVRRFPAVHLNGAEVAELLGDTRVKAFADLAARLRGGVNGTKITGRRGRGHDTRQNGQTCKFQLRDSTVARKRTASLKLSKRFSAGAPRRGRNETERVNRGDDGAEEWAEFRCATQRRGRG